MEGLLEPQKRRREMTHIVLGELKHFVKASGSQKEAAKRLKVTPAYLHDVLKGRRGITEKLAAKLGWEKQVTWIYRGKP